MEPELKDNNPRTSELEGIPKLSSSSPPWTWGLWLAAWHRVGPPKWWLTDGCSFSQILTFARKNTAAITNRLQPFLASTACRCELLLKSSELFMIHTWEVCLKRDLQFSLFFKTKCLINWCIRQYNISSWLRPIHTASYTHVHFLGSCLSCNSPASLRV